MQTLRGIPIKMCSKHMQQIFLKESMLGHFLMISMHSLSTIPLIALLCFPLLKCKRILQVVRISQ